MAINYAEKYSNIVDERFRLGALTNGLVNNDYDWIGVETVEVYSIPTVAMSNYTLTGNARYGTAAELQNVKQALQVTQDRAFTFSIDRKSVDDTMGVMAAASALRREIDEVAIPEIDTYRLAALVTGCPSGNLLNTTAASSTTAYDILLSLNEKIDEGKVGRGGRVAYVTPTFYKYIKLDDAFVKKGDMSQQIAINGLVGEVDGCAIVVAPTSYFPTDTNAIVTQLGLMPAPTKLMDFKIHDNPVGINGFLVEGRIRYDAFVLTNKAAAIAVSQNP